MRNFDDYSKVYNLYYERYNMILQTSGIAYIPDFSLYKEYFKSYTIPTYQAYRPDKIVFELWGNQFLVWILNAINNFDDGIKEYTSNRVIYYLEKNVLQNIGVI